MKIVFLVGSYYPVFSATGKCVGNIADVFTKEEENRVIVISQKTSVDEPDVYNIHNQEQHRFSTPIGEKRLRLEERLRKKERKLFTEYIDRSALFVIRTYDYIRMLCSRGSLRNEVVKAYRNELDRIEDIDIIIPACLPFETVAASSQYAKEHSGVKVFPVFFDKFADNDNLHRTRWNKRLKYCANQRIERETIKHAACIFATKSICEYFEYSLREIDIPHVEIEHPLLVERRAKVCSASNHERIKIVFTGALLKNYVEPNYILRLLPHFDVECEVDFYSKGNACGEIEKCKQNNISLKGWVSHDVLQSALADADMFLSIAEKCGVQVSSKIFEYMSYGKPILHIYSVDNDVNLRYLKNYPLALCIKESEASIDENASQVSGWIKNVLDKHIPYEEVSKRFHHCTPEFIARRIETYTNVE